MTANAYGDDDYQTQSPQDDLTTDDNVSDPVMQEENEDLSEKLGIPADGLRDELNRAPTEDDEERYHEYPREDKVEDETV